MSDSLILGTAGHIDHGKSTLVRTLTGTDPDRLAEEKKRGITIELGFAELTLDDGSTLGVVDVPGHERFVRQMVQGATGVDLALIVIAADDGVMPQTIEHINILTLLGVETAVIALTKCDMVDEDWIELMKGEIREALSATPFADSPLVAVSATTSQGIDELRRALTDAAHNVKCPSRSGSMRLPVDRSFTIRGAGTVVTGTLWSGTLAPEAVVEVLPGGQTARIRGLQEHGESVTVAHAGQRVAVNVAGLSVDDVRPGDMLVEPGTIALTDRIDVRFTYMGAPAFSRPLESGAVVTVDHGTTEVRARLLFINGRAQVNVGESCFAQLRLEHPLAALSGDRFIVRYATPLSAIGGGVILEPGAHHRTNLTEQGTAFITALDEGNIDTATTAALQIADGPLRIADLAQRIGRTVDQALETAQANGAVILNAGSETYATSTQALKKWLSRIDAALKKFHTTNPDVVGITPRALMHSCGGHIDEPAFDALLASAIEREAVIRIDTQVAHPQASSGARAAEAQLADKAHAEQLGNGRTPQPVKYLAADLGVDEKALRRALALLKKDGRMVQIDADTFYAAEVYEQILADIKASFTVEPCASAAQLRDAIGTSRRFAIPFLEYLDAQGITVRDGDTRRLL